MAKTTTVGTKVESKTHQRLVKRAARAGLTVSEVLRLLIEDALKEEENPTIAAIPEELSARLDAVEKLALKATRAAAKAQFLASMSVGFTSDLSKLMVSGQLPTSAQKTDFQEQTNQWAEGFAQKYLQEE